MIRLKCLGGELPVFVEFHQPFGPREQNGNEPVVPAAVLNELTLQLMKESEHISSATQLYTREVNTLLTEPSLLYHTIPEHISSATHNYR